MEAGGIERGEEEGGCLLGDKPLDDTGGHQSLLGVQVRRRLVNQVNIGRFTQTQSESNSLQLTTRQVRNLKVGVDVSVLRPALQRHQQDNLLLLGQ